MVGLTTPLLSDYSGVVDVDNYPYNTALGHDIMYQMHMWHRFNNGGAVEDLQQYGLCCYCNGTTKYGGNYPCDECEDNVRVCGKCVRVMCAEIVQPPLCDACKSGKPAPKKVVKKMKDKPLPTDSETDRIPKSSTGTARRTATRRPRLHHRQLMRWRRRLDLPAVAALRRPRRAASG